MYRDIRSAAESGWDFSTRWFQDGKKMETIATTQFLPVDLNCLLYNLEMALSHAYKIKHDLPESNRFKKLAENRKQSILKYCWDTKNHFFADYDLSTASCSQQLTLAALFPLFFQLATNAQAEQVKNRLESDFLMPGGLVTTLVEDSGQQWDYPNAWAPLQWMAYKGLKNYHFDALADEIAKRWLNLNMKVYFETGKMMEKYDVVDINRPGGGGEYKTQDGFGWTNGVFLKFWNEVYPQSGTE